MSNIISFYVLSAMLGVAAGMPAHAQNAAPQASDPARWYVDDATAAAQLRTLRKEIGAAWQEAQKECRNAPAAERGACQKEARATYQQDMAHAEQQRAVAHPQSP